MSNALGRFLRLFYRAPTNPGGRGRRAHDDPGVPLTDEHVAQQLSLLTERQRAALNEDVISQLADAMDVAITDRGQTWPAVTQPDRTEYVKGVFAGDAASGGVALVTWAIVHGLVARLDSPLVHDKRGAAAEFWIRDAIIAMHSRHPALDLEQVRLLLESSRCFGALAGNEFNLTIAQSAVDAIAAHREEWAFSAEDRQVLGQLADHLSQWATGGKERARIAMLREIVAGGPSVFFWDGEPWGRLLNQDLSAMAESERQAWQVLLSFSATCHPTKPSKAWLKDLAKTAGAVESPAFEERLLGWMRGFISVPRPAEPDYSREGGHEDWNSWQRELAKYKSNTSQLVGLMWITQARWTPRFAPVLADVAETVARLPLRAREPSVQVGNAAVRALAARDEDDALAQLTRLEVRIRWPKLKKLVKKQTEEVIARRGLARAEVEESLVPDFGLRDGIAMMRYDGIDAEITLGSGDKPSARWKLPDGKVAKVMPRDLKAKNVSAAGDVKQAVADIEKMRAAQRTRLDLLMRRPRSWPCGLWRQRYLDHGLVGSIARRLIWLVGDAPVIWRDGALVDLEGKAQTPPTDATVRLWHPLERAMDEVIAWRNVLEQWEITQPFKQAHREIYPLTDAERRTEVYSNRFAAHIVRTMSLLSISQVRQWKSGLYGGQSSPSFELADYGLRAEWWMEMAGDESTSFGSPLYLATDQVRFNFLSDESARRYGFPLGAVQPMPVERVPPLAFSEIMRDIDLFVAIASVGNDPTWQDGGPGGRFRDYWNIYSFGELAGSAKTRKAVLEKLIPRLKIAPRCAFDDKFLIVRGDVRTYKIHLGSANILMTPNDQYLCIVAAPGGSKAGDAPRPGGVFLPFDGDERLSVIISKALMLADDTKITDPTITRQIGRK